MRRHLRQRQSLRRLGRMRLVRGSTASTGCAHRHHRELGGEGRRCEVGPARRADTSSSATRCGAVLGVYAGAHSGWTAPRPSRPPTWPHPAQGDEGHHAYPSATAMACKYVSRDLLGIAASWHTQFLLSRAYVPIRRSVRSRGRLIGPGHRRLMRHADAWGARTCRGCATRSVTPGQSRWRTPLSGYYRGVGRFVRCPAVTESDVHPGLVPVDRRPSGVASRSRANDVGTVGRR